MQNAKWHCSFKSKFSDLLIFTNHILAFCAEICKSEYSKILLEYMSKIWQSPKFLANAVPKYKRQHPCNLEHEANLGVESISSNNMNLRLTRTYKSRPKCEEVVCTYEHATAISFCSLHFASCILHLASCILHFTKFAGWQKQTFPNAFTKSMCNCVMSGCKSNSACIYSWIYICNQRWQKPGQVPLAALMIFFFWTSVLAKRRTMLATFCKVFGSGHLQDAKFFISIGTLLITQSVLQTDK